MWIALRTLKRVIQRPPARRTTLSVEALDLALSTPANSHTSSDQTESPVAWLNSIQRRTKEHAIDQVFTAFEVNSGS
jgi:hypothetical protein